MIRYSNYKDSGVEWIGKIPENWEISRLKYLADGSRNSFIDGDWIESKDISDDGIRYITTGNIGQGYYKEQGGGFVSEETFIRLNCTELFEGDLIISRLSPPVGRSCILPDLGLRLITSVDNVLLRPKNGIDKKYLNYYFNHIKYQEHNDLLSRGTTLIRISRSMLGNNSVIIPPLSEQQAIVTYLDEKTILIDDLIKKKQEKIQLLKENRTALINHVVTKGLDPEVEKKDSDVEWIGEVPEHWIISRLKLVATVRSGFALNNSTKKENTVSYPYLRVANVQDGYLNLSTVTEVEMDSDSASRYFLQYGDLLMNEGGDNDKLGRGCVWREEITPCLHQNHVFAVRMNPLINSEWINLLTLTSYARQYFLLNCKQSTNLASISQSSIKELPVLLPPISEQESIIEYLNEQTQLIDQTIQQEEQKIELLKEYRQSLISEVVTGKICLL